MVLKNSKYDKQAKRKHLAKNGPLKRPPTNKITPKWSSKAKNDKSDTITLDIDDMNSDWDSDIDEEIVNYFYPTMVDDVTEMNDDQKRTIKRQIIEDLKVQRENGFNEGGNGDINGDVDGDVDGIYLGKIPETPETKLSDFVPEIPISAASKKKYNRKLPHIQDNSDILQDYGLEDYKETITKDPHDYHKVHETKLANQNLDKISTQDLIGFKVGRDRLGVKNTGKNTSKNTIRSLTQEERKENEHREKLRQQNDFYISMKKTFGSEKAKNKVLDLNNFDENNSDHIAYINNRIVNNEEDDVSLDIDDDLDELLGGKLSIKEDEEGEEGEIGLKMGEKDSKHHKNQSKHHHTTTKPPPSPKTLPKDDQQFLDDLIGM